MNRRRLLGLVGAGALSSIAGCGYAAGGGDRYDTASVPSIDGDTRRFFARDGDTMALGASGLQWLRRDPEEPPEFTTGTRVAVVSTDGRERWRFVTDNAARAISLGARVFLTLDGGVILASETIDPGARDWSVNPATTVDWAVERNDVGPGIAAAGETVYITAGNQLLEMRDGTVSWNTDIPGPGRELFRVDESIIIVGETWIAGVTDRQLAWELPISTAATASLAGGVLALLERDRLRVIDAATGSVVFEDPDAGGDGQPLLTDQHVFVLDGSQLVAFDRDTGRDAWQVPITGRGDGSVVADESGTYLARDDGTITAIRAGKPRWQTEIDASGQAVTAWIDGPAVAVLVSDGTIAWVRRRAEDPGLMW